MDTDKGFSPGLPTRIIEVIPIAIVILGLLFWLYNSY